MILSSKNIFYALDLSVELSCSSCMLLFPDLLMYVLLYLYERYAHDEETAEDQEETGWKYIHGDVFRYPKYKSLFAACLGSGTQLFTL